MQLKTKVYLCLLSLSFLNFREKNKKQMAVFSIMKTCWRGKQWFWLSATGVSVIPGQGDGKYRQTFSSDCHCLLTRSLCV